MGIKGGSGISWTDETWNPWMGCLRVSPGCDNCYADRDMTRYGKNFDVVTRTSPATFNKPLKLKDPSLIFTCSWSDFFIHDADPWREEAWDIIKATPQHTYQILTKRPGLAVQWAKDHGWPENAWLGVTVESQKYAPRIDVAIRIRQVNPNALVFVSYEPALGPLNFAPWVGHMIMPMHRIQWIICGGESGPGHRMDNPDWYRTVRDQCHRTGVAFHLKQYSGFRPSHNPELDGRQWREMPHGYELRV